MALRTLAALAITALSVTTFAAELKPLLKNETMYSYAELRLLFSGQYEDLADQNCFRDYLKSEQHTQRQSFGAFISSVKLEEISDPTGVQATVRYSRIINAGGMGGERLKLHDRVGESYGSTPDQAFLVCLFKRVE